MSIALRPGVRSRLPMAFRLVCLVGVVWFLVVPELRRSSRSLHLLTDIDSEWIPVALAAELASLGVFAMATRTLISRPSRPRLHHVVRIDLSSIAISHCLPAGSAAGSALSWRLLTRAGVPTAEAGVVKLVQGFGSVIVLQVMLLAASICAVPTYGVHSAAIYPPAVDAAFVIAIAAGLFASHHRGSKHTAGGLARRVLRLRLLDRHRAGLDRLRHAGMGYARSILEDPRRLAHAAGWSTANWAFDCLALWASLRAYGGSIPPDGVVLAFGIASMIAWAPLTPSGLGTTEGVMIPLLVLFGSSSPAAVLGVLTWRLMSFWLPIPLGGLAYGSLRLRPQ